MQRGGGGGGWGDMSPSLYNLDGPPMYCPLPHFYHHIYLIGRSPYIYTIVPAPLFIEIPPITSRLEEVLVIVYNVYSVFTNDLPAA